MTIATVVGCVLACVLQSSPEGNSYPWTGGSGTFHAVEALDFDGDLEADLLIRQGDDLAVIWAISFNGTQIPVLGSGVNDACAVAGAAATGGDTIVVATTTRLESLEYEHDPEPAFVSTEISLDPGDDLAMVRSADLDGDGDGDLVTVDDDLVTVRIWLQDQDGDYEDQSPFTLPADALDCRILRWFSTGDPCLAFLTTTRLYVYDQTGTTQYLSVRTFYPGQSIAVVGEGAKDRIALLTLNSAGTGQLLALYGSGGSDEEGPYALGSTQFTQIAAGDYWMDGNDDLVFRRAVGADWDVVRNLRDEQVPPGPGFDHYSPGSYGSDVGKFTLSTATSSETSRPVFTDMDSDGQADLAAAIESTLEIAFRPGSWADIPEPPEDTYEPMAHDVFTESYFEHQSQPTVLHIHMDDDFIHPLATHVRVHTWTATPSTPPDAEDSTVLLFDLNHMEVCQPGLQQGDICLKTPTDLIQDVSDTIYYFRVRSVQLYGGQTISAGKSHVSSFTYNEWDDSLGWLLGFDSFLYLIGLTDAWETTIPFSKYPPAGGFAQSLGKVPLVWIPFAN